MLKIQQLLGEKKIYLSELLHCSGLTAYEYSNILVALEKGADIKLSTKKKLEKLADGYSRISGAVESSEYLFSKV